MSGEFLKCLILKEFVSTCEEIYNTNIEVKKSENLGIYHVHPIIYD